jgi:hypothetical protein
MQSVYAFGLYCRRIEKEMLRLPNDFPGMKGIISNIELIKLYILNNNLNNILNNNNTQNFQNFVYTRHYHFRYASKDYLVYIPFDYPHGVPTVFRIEKGKKKKLWRPVNWSPICRIGSLILTYVTVGEEEYCST